MSDVPAAHSEEWLEALLRDKCGYSQLRDEATGIEVCVSYISPIIFCSPIVRTSNSRPTDAPHLPTPSAAPTTASGAPTSSSLTTYAPPSAPPSPLSKTCPKTRRTGTPGRTNKSSTSCTHRSTLSSTARRSASNPMARLGPSLHLRPPPEARATRSWSTACRTRRS